MASEGVHLSLGGGNMEEVTCTVIGGVSSTQICMSDSKRQAEDNDCMIGELHWELTLQVPCKVWNVLNYHFIIFF